jgi:tRNA A-37 threonylcarbamoyl transferase component Bud32
MAEVETDVELGQRYRLVRRIAVGGMGSVWEAEDIVLHRRVAVKLLSDSLSTDRRFADRFRREAQAAARLSHPNIAGVFDYGEDDGHQFFVMELVQGPPLSDLLAHAGRIDPSEAVRITVAIASALEVAHEAGIVHRDVKPGNVMLTRSGEVKVLDFGVAAATGAPLTATGARMGTATYLSPEQATGEPPSPASDVYSLGVVLYEMLAGRPPFTGDTPVGVAAQHAQRQPPPLGELAADVPPHVVAACEQALAKDPAARPRSAAAFAAMLLSPEGTAATTAPAAGPASPGGPTTTLVLPPVEPTSVLGETGPAPVRRRPRRPTRRLAPLVIAAVLVALAAVVLGLVLKAGRGGTPTTPPSTPPSQTSAMVAVPNVVGEKRDDAEKLLQDKGFAVRDVAAQGKHDMVVSTDPPPDTLVAPGSTVTLYVGSGPQDHGKGKGKGNSGDD